MSDEGKAGDRAREVHARLVAARLRRLQADGASADELLAALHDGPAHERAWELGADGEEVVAGVLDTAAARRGFGVLHDLAVPGSRANIDHVVVGAGGVTVIDTKAWSGPVVVGPRGVRVGGWGKRREVEAIAAQVELVTDVLMAAGFDVPVHGVLCLANRNVGASAALQATGPVWVGTAKAVVDSVSRGGACLRIEAITIMDVLERHFRPRSVVKVGAALHVLPEPAGAFSLSVRARRGTWPRPARRSSTGAPSRRRGRSSARGGSRETTAELVVKLILIGALFWGALTVLGRGVTRHPLTATSLLAMRADLRSRAVAAAGGPVHGPSIAMTTRHFRLRYRRAGCTIRIDLNRATARTAADGALVPGRRCPRH